MSNTVKGFKGYAEILKVSGSGPIGNGVQVGVPYFSCDPRNPTNDTYTAAVNKSANPSLVVRGKLTPSMMIDTAAKATWFTPNWLNTLILTADADNDTDLLAIRANDGDTTTTVYDGCRCGSVVISHAAAGSYLGVQMGFIATDPAGVTAFTGSGSTDAGELLNASGIDFGAGPTQDLVRGCRLSLVRPQAYDFFSNKSYNPSGVSSGMLGGAFEIEYSPKAVALITSTATMRIYTGVPGAQVLHMTLTLYLNLDEPIYTRTVGFGNIRKAFSLIRISTGGPAIICA